MPTKAPKEVLTVRLDRDDIDLLKALAEKNVRTVASETAYLIRRAAQDENVTLPVKNDGV